MRSESNLFEPADPLSAALLDPAAYPHPVSGLRLIETHISWVVLTGEFAYKIKKPVRFSFADFSTLSRRRYFCKEELRLNARFAPQLYVDVVPIGGTRSAPRVGQTPAIDYAVRLRQFATDSRLDRQLELGEFAAGDARQLGMLVADYQVDLEQDCQNPRFGSAESIGRIVMDNLREIEGLVACKGVDLRQVESWTVQATEELAPALDARKAGGFIREGHGDLHLENLVRLDDGSIAPFDALEFDPALRWVDTLDEAAFAAMDLMARGRRDLAWILLNAWFERSGDYAGLQLLRFYLIYRALVRAKVVMLRAAVSAGETLPDEAAAYLDLACQLARRARPLLILTHGVSGSGKTTFSEALIGALGAVRIRSDVERKRLHGLEAGASSGSEIDAGLYDEAATDRTYDALAAGAEHALRAGFNVIVDATFLKKSQRERFRKLAAEVRARRIILDCRAPRSVLRDRLRGRAELAEDASEAGEAVMKSQLESLEPLCWDEQCSQVLIDSPGAAHVPILVRQILALGNHLQRRSG